MAQLPVYRQQKNITTDAPAQVRDLDTFAQQSIGLQKTGNALYELAAKWQESKDAVENLDGKNKLMSGISEILDEAENYNDYKTPEDLTKKQQELTQRMNNLVPSIVSGFSNNQNAHEFEVNGQFTTQQNTFKLQDLFRQKYGDMYNANLQQTADSALRNFTKTGDEAYKQEYFEAIDTGVNAGYLNRAQAEKLKLGTNEWNYNYVYSQILENPYFKASDEVMEKIDPVHQRTLKNFQRTEIKRAEAEAGNNALNRYCLNPNEQNLKELYRLNPDLKGDKGLENLSKKPVNYNTSTTFEGMSEALNAVKKLASMDVSKPEGKRAYTKEAARLAGIINNSGNLSQSKKQKLFNMIYNDMIDDNFRQKLSKMPDISKSFANEYFRDANKLQQDYYKANKEYLRIASHDHTPDQLQKAKTKRDQAKKAYTYYQNFQVALNKNRSENLKAPVSVQNRMVKLQREASSLMLDAYTRGDVKKANQIMEAYGNDMVRLKYWNIPELQRKNLKIGTKFTVNGKVYSYQGFSKNDVIVEVH